LNAHGGVDCEMTLFIAIGCVRNGSRTDAIFLRFCRTTGSFSRIRAPDLDWMAERSLLVQYAPAYYCQYRFITKQSGESLNSSLICRV